MKKIILADNKDKFIITIHAFSEEKYPKRSQFQWYVIDDPNGENPIPLKGQVYESITITSEDIRKNHQDRWLYCKCELLDESYDEGCVYLINDFVKMIKLNQFDKIIFSGKDGTFMNGNMYIHTACITGQNR